MFESHKSQTTIFLNTSKVTLLDIAYIHPFSVPLSSLIEISFARLFKGLTLVNFPVRGKFDRFSPIILVATIANQKRISFNFK